MMLEILVTIPYFPKEGAIKVTQALNQLGNFQDHVTPIGVGPVCPVATNETEEGRAKNRRVEIVLRKKF